MHTPKRPTEIDKEQLYAKFGITRFADITDLDVIGIPVSIAVRPNSKTLSVSSGKGVCVEAANLCAYMVAIEASTCEDIGGQVAFVCSWQELQEKGKTSVPLGRIARCRIENFDTARARAWVAGRSMLSNEQVYAPFELVGLDYRIPSHWDNSAFVMTSGGIGAGFDIEHALTHALLEIVEDDAVAVAEMFGAFRRVKITKKLRSSLRNTYLACFHAGFDVVFHLLDSPTKIPVIRCDIYPTHSSLASFSAIVGCGYGTNPNPYLAAKSALLEAVQSRAVNISGSREDILDNDYPRGPAKRNLSCDPVSVDLECLTVNRSMCSREIVKAMLCFEAVEDLYHFSLKTRDPSVFVSRVLAPVYADCAGAEVLASNSRLSLIKGY